VSALRAEHLTARYQGTPSASAALVDVDLTLEAGDRLLLLGPNGAGKSTFLRVFAGLMRPTNGHATILGEPPARVRHAVGVVSHATYLYDELTALENLRLYAELYGVAQPAMRAGKLLDQVGLTQVGESRVGRLSRGQQQRVTLARALLHEPSVLLLDEPDTGLDLAAFGILEDLTTRREQTVVLTTHNLAAGLRLGTRVAVLAHGQVVHEQRQVSPGDAGPLGELLERLARA
jgi:ABC-type multidrug transport system ATPase subunit